MKKVKYIKKLLVKLLNNVAFPTLQCNCPVGLKIVENKWKISYKKES